VSQCTPNKTIVIKQSTQYKESINYLHQENGKVTTNIGSEEALPYISYSYNAPKEGVWID
jgi:hypothetical protein